MFSINAIQGNLRQGNSYPKIFECEDTSLTEEYHPESIQALPFQLLLHLSRWRWRLDNSLYWCWLQASSWLWSKKRQNNDQIKEWGLLRLDSEDLDWRVWEQGNSGDARKGLYYQWSLLNTFK